MNRQMKNEKKKTIYMKNQIKRLSVVLLVLLGMCCPAMADQWGHEKTDNYTIYKKSDGVYHFKLLVTRRRSGTDDFVWSTGAMNVAGTKNGEGIVWIESDHGKDTIVQFVSAFTAGRPDSNDGGGDWGWTDHLGLTYFRTLKGASELTDARLVADDSRLINLPAVNGPNNELAFFLEFDWYVPREMCGYSNVQFSYKVNCKGNPIHGGSWYGYNYVQNNQDYSQTKLTGENFPGSYTPHPAQLQQPIPAIDMGDGQAQPGLMMLMLTAQQDAVHSYRLPGASGYTELEELSYAPTIYRPISDVETRNYTVWTKLVYNGGRKEMNAITKEWMKDAGSLIWDYCNTYEAAAQNSVDIPAYHRIHDFRVSWRIADKTYELRDGAIELTWKIAHPRERDAFESDMFEIQRDTLEDFSTAETIAAINYDANPADSAVKNDTLTYTYMDASPEVKKGNGKADFHYYYRIRRVSSSMWDWDEPGINTDRLYASGLAAKGEMVSAYGERVYLVGFEEEGSIKTDTATYRGTHQLRITASLQNLREDHKNKYYYDGTPIYLVKKMISHLHQDTVVQEIRIPQDSIIGGGVSWRIQYTDTTNTPCVKYAYSLRVDTALSTLRVVEYKKQSLLDQERVCAYEVPCSYWYVEDSAFFSGGMKLDRDTAVSFATKTNPSSVFLKWGTVGGAFDYYTIDRRAAGDSVWTTIATDLEDLFYDDHSSPVGRDCEFRIIGTEVCDRVLRDTIVLTGRRYEYGSIAGHVMMPGGLAYAGVTVMLECDSLHVNEQTVTDKSGYYKFDHLFYSESGINYKVFPVSANAYDNFGQLRQVDLSGWSAEPENINFVNSNAVKFSGRVLYEHSSVPVSHCHFLVNGQLALNTDGTAYETDASGNFELLVPAGSTTVRGVMDGHTFLNDGYFLMAGDSLLPLTENISAARLYDQTKVTVVGHVAGGTEQGLMPWGDLHAANNLGDNLTLVFELEGDNISQLVRFDDDRSEVDTTYVHPLRGQTEMQMTKKRVIVHPDATTGEYRVELFPVRWKLVQATAEGYSSLLPQGKTSVALNLIGTETHADTIRLGGQHMAVHCLNNVVYRAPVSLTYQQLYYGMKVDYLGEPQMVYAAIDGSYPVSLIERDSTGAFAGYLLGHPVFQAGQKYTYVISAHEDYYYNNNPSDSRHDQVMLKGIDVRVINNMNKSGKPETVHLHDATGEGRVTLLVNAPTFSQQGAQALRKIEMEADIEGLYVHAAPIEGFIAAAEEKHGTDAVVAEMSMPTLQDVVNDPYGSTSSAYVDGGVKYTAHQNLKLSVTGGLTISISSGTSGEFVSGISSGIGPFVGQVTTASTLSSHSIPITTGAHATWNYDYSYSTSERISTSSATTMVGAKADVYIGQVIRNYVARADAVTLIDSAMYAMKQPAFQSGQMLLLAQSRIEGKPYYLVRGESLVMGAQPMEANFAYTQDHILKVVIPELERQRNDLILVGVDTTTAQNLANQERKAVYISAVGLDQPDFGFVYRKIDATRDDAVCDNSDKVAQYNRQIAKWQSFIYDNEKRKLTILQKGKLMGDYSVVAGASRTFSESVSHAGYWSGIVFDGISAGYDFSGWVTSGGTKYQRDPSKKEVKNADLIVQDEFDQFWQADLKVFGFSNKIKITPKLTPSFSRDANTTDSDTKSAGFTLSMNNEGYEDIAVYRLTDNSFNKEAEYDRGMADGVGSGLDDDYVYADYVFVRKGGATRCPYEAEEKTLFYKPGTTLAPATVKIDDPHLELSTRMIDNVPSDQDVSIVVTMSNQSTYNPTVVSSDFVLYVDDDTNPNGLQFFIDGSPLGEGHSFFLSPGTSLEKTLVIRRGNVYDYDDISLVLQHGCQRTNVTSTTFSVHYEPVSCPVTLALPVQNWLMNTLSPADRDGFYIPVEITGFNTQYDNFDHLELQYKLAVESDDRYVTLCSYYADSAYLKLGSGNRQMIDGATIRTSFYGERDPMEQQYDLRAVSYCRLGTGFVSRSSEVKHGVKDTRVPQLFGTALPSNGILGVGDYISIPFSEDIAANYLDEDNNFQITGYTNSSVITSTTSLRFDAEPTAYAATELTRNLLEKDVTFDVMVRPESAGRSMTYMMHGSDRSLLGFGQRHWGTDARGRDRICLDLEMDLGDRIYHAVSDTLPLSNNWTRVAAVYHQATGHVDFYCGTSPVPAAQGKDSLPTGYSSVGKIYLGNNPSLLGMDGYRFSGNMLEARLWSKALTPAEIKNTNMCYLTGYEQGLLAYYPLNEGRGEQAEDKASGAHIGLHGVEWSIPEGKSMHLDGHKLLLDGNAFSSTDMNDYTLTMWFRETEENVAGEGTQLFRSGSFSLTLFGDRIVLTSDKFTTEGRGRFMDGQWHQVALSVNRALGTSALYADGRSLAQFSSSLIGAPGASVAEIGPMKGYVDELTFWETALPDNYLTSFYGHTPNDEELALVAHLGFTRRQENSSGIYETVYSPYNMRVRRDREGRVLPLSEADRVVITPDAEAAPLLTDGNAPVNEKADLTKIKFNWIGRGNELVINLTVPDRDINKQNVFVTVRDVEDLHGNPMPSPLTWTLFIDRNQLRWSKPYIDETIIEGEPLTVSLDVINEGGTTGNFYMADLPWWLTADYAQGSLSPLEQTPINLTVSDQLNPGEYDEIIYLTDGNGLSEPLRLRITVEANQPNWTVDKSQAGQESMGLFAQVLIKGARGSNYYPTDERDIVAAFAGNLCIGKQNLQMIGLESMVIMNLYGNYSDSTKVLDFYYWQASTGKIYSLKPEGDSIRYKALTVKGSPEAPVQLVSTELLTQQIGLQAGWNWVSFFLDPQHKAKAGFYSALDGQYTFTTGDMVVGPKGYMDYSKRPSYPGVWNGTPFTFSADSVYFLHVAKPGQMGVVGTLIADSCRFVKLGSGWNYLPYKMSTTQDISTALAGYFDHAQQGDIIKSYDAFAVYSTAVNAWIGSLTHLKPGEGYMLFRNGSDSVVMPYVSDVRATYAPVRREVATSLSGSRFNMPMVLTVDGCREGDILEALIGGKVVTSAQADAEGRFWMLISAAEGSDIRFRYAGPAGEADIAQPIFFRSDIASVGSADSPYSLLLGGDMADVYPSPFSDHIVFTASGEENAPVEFALYDAAGRCLWMRTCRIEGGACSYTLADTESYPQGVYIARVKVAGTQKQVKLIKE